MKMRCRSAQRHMHQANDDRIDDNDADAESRSDGRRATAYLGAPDGSQNVSDGSGAFMVGRKSHTRTHGRTHSAECTCRHGGLDGGGEVGSAQVVDCDEDALDDLHGDESWPWAEKENDEIVTDVVRRTRADRR